MTESNEDSALRLKLARESEEALAMELMLINAEVLEKRRLAAASFILILGQRKFF